MRNALVLLAALLAAAAAQPAAVARAASVDPLGELALALLPSPTITIQSVTANGALHPASDDKLRAYCKVLHARTPGVCVAPTDEGDFARSLCPDQCAAAAPTDAATRTLLTYNSTEELKPCSQTADTSDLCSLFIEQAKGACATAGFLSVYMHMECRKSCGFCTPDAPSDAPKAPTVEPPPNPMCTKAPDAGSACPFFFFHLANPCSVATACDAWIANYTRTQCQTSCGICLPGQPVEASPEPPAAEPSPPAEPSDSSPSPSPVIGILDCTDLSTASFSCADVVKQELCDQPWAAGWCPKSCGYCGDATAPSPEQPTASPVAEQPGLPPAPEQEPAPASPATDEPTPSPPAGEQPTPASPAPEGQPVPASPAAEQPQPPSPAAEQPQPPSPAAEQPQPPSPADEKPQPPSPAPEQPVPASPADEQPVPASPAAEQPQSPSPAAEQPQPTSPAAEQPVPASPAAEQPQPPSPAEELSPLPSPSPPAAENTSPLPVESPATQEPVPAEQPSPSPTAPSQPGPTGSHGGYYGTPSQPGSYGGYSSSPSPSVPSHAGPTGSHGGYYGTPSQPANYGGYGSSRTPSAPTASPSTEPSSSKSSPSGEAPIPIRPLFGGAKVAAKRHLMAAADHGTSSTEKATLALHSGLMAGVVVAAAVAMMVVAALLALNVRPRGGPLPL